MIECEVFGVWLDVVTGANLTQNVNCKMISFRAFKPSQFPQDVLSQTFFCICFNNLSSASIRIQIDFPNLHYSLVDDSIKFK